MGVRKVQKVKSNKNTVHEMCDGLVTLVLVSSPSMACILWKEDTRRPSMVQKKISEKTLYFGNKSLKYWEYNELNATYAKYLEGLSSLSQTPF